MFIAFAAWCPNCNKCRIAAVHPLREICGERKSFNSLVLVDQIFNSRFINRDLAHFEASYLTFVCIDTSNKMSQFGEAGAGYKTDITRPNYTNFHI